MNPQEHIRTPEAYDRLLRGIVGYIYWAWDHDMPTRPVLANVLHDLAGTLRHGPTLTPRSRDFVGYQPRKTPVRPPRKDDAEWPDPADLIV